MTERQPDARLRILSAAAALVAEAGQAGLVVTIETTPQQPLAMGNYKMALNVRDKRGASAPAAEVGQGVDAAPAAFDTRDQRIQVLEAALRFYADGCHFNLSDKDAWDTVSGEPQNFWCDEEGTATMEDGTVAAMALKGTPLLDEEEQALPAMGAEALVRQMFKALDDATGKDTSGFQAMAAASAWLAGQPVPISRQDWRTQAEQIYLAVGDTAEVARECALYLCDQQDWLGQEVDDPGMAAQADLQERPHACRGTLTHAQRLDLSTAAFTIASRNDPTCVLKEPDAERILGLLSNLAGMDLDAIEGTPHGQPT
ncbi:hypothetical protein [Acidovorax sp. Root219]|uniref:hypothetical protein n=1 Tax=Acidovorax sp. Root219 TaxID=1736493 RepID=UPI00070CD7F6|nr:hypothetical protein [Acidovorax sp. Root219]KRC36278.1 hypothetical protein ASE28_01730 [Acidovorax sp. Root219]